MTSGPHTWSRLRLRQSHMFYGDEEDCVKCWRVWLLRHEAQTISPIPASSFDYCGFSSSSEPGEKTRRWLFCDTNDWVTRAQRFYHHSLLDGLDSLHQLSRARTNVTVKVGNLSLRGDPSLNPSSCTPATKVGFLKTHKTASRCRELAITSFWVAIQWCQNQFQWQKLHLKVQQYYLACVLLM